MNQRVIPPAAWVVATLVFAASLFCVFIISMRTRNESMLPIVALIAGVALSGYSLLIGYIYGDAKRRGMRYVMWTWLAILVPNAIGIILYFILRDPIPSHCTDCGATVPPGLAYCPQCGAGLAPICRQCHRVSQPGWTHCAYCGVRL